MFFAGNAQALTVNELKETFKEHQYKDYIYMPKWQYPPVFINSLPSNWASIKDSSERNRLFIMILTPLALKVNLEISVERDELLLLEYEFLKNEGLTEKQQQTLENAAKKYDVFTRLQGFRRSRFLFEKLKEKIDTVPPSILIAAAAIESNWGDSPAAIKGNSLYKEKNWYSTEGLETGDKEDASYKIKTFPDLISSMRSYALKINSSLNYDQFRIVRAELRYREKPLIGRNMVHTMIFDSNLENFAGLLDYTITFYELTNLDEAYL